MTKLSDAGRGHDSGNNEWPVGGLIQVHQWWQSFGLF